MKVISPIFSSVSGKLGGCVGMTSKFGPQLRALVIPANPQTGPQFIVRNILAELSSIWRDTLTADQRDGWTELAEDSSGNGSGLNMFVKQNQERVRAGRGYLANATLGSSSFFTAPTSIIDDSANTIVVSFNVLDPWFVSGGECGMNIYVSTEQPITRNTRLHPYILVGTVDAGDTSPKTISLVPFLRTVAGKVCYTRYVAWGDSDPVTLPFAERKTIVA